MGSGQKATGTGGVMIGEGVYLRLAVAAEAGYDTNVFYNDQARTDSATFMVTPSVEISNATRDGSELPVSFSLGVSMVYREYINDDSQVRAQRALNPTFGGVVAYNSGSQVLSLSDQYTRLEDPPYEKGGEPLTRNYNMAAFTAGLSPGGGRLPLLFRYTNTLDLFEGNQFNFGNRMSHDALLDLSWKWLPKTSVYLAGGIGYTQYLSDEADTAGKSNSLPYRVSTGLRGLVTPKLTVMVGVGFADAIYDNKAINPTGASNLGVMAVSTYTASEWTSLGAGYAHEFRDSPVLGSYYDLDSFDLGVAQRVGPVSLTLAGRYEYRRYKGFQFGQPIGRKDNIYQVRLSADYLFQKWFYTGFSYSTLISRSSDAAASAMMAAGALDYSKHLILGRVGVTY
jgi:hypothetical protein